MPNFKALCWLPIILFVFACNGKAPKQWTDLNSTVPQYDRLEYWAAHPLKTDSSDLVPLDLKDYRTLKEADVFFLYPTIYWQKRSDKLWNAPIDDPKLNERIDAASLKNQASIFNAVGRVYAPRYRQAHIDAYYAKDPGAAAKAFEIAYEDVRKAFQYYLEHYNKGRPFFIASHSQGTTHGMRLVKEFIDGTVLEDQLVAAYLVGIGVPAFYYNSLKPCTYPTEIDCICSWRTFRRGYYPKDHFSYLSDYINTNPISWTNEAATTAMHKGAILYNFDALEAGICEAEQHEGLIWMDKPKFKGSAFFVQKNYHIGDFNLFYLDVRENAINRLNTWLELNKEIR